MCICAQIWVHAHYIYISKYSPKVLTIFVFVLVLLFQTWRTISKRCYSTILCSCKLWCKLIVILSGKLLFKNVLTCPLWPYLVIPLKPSLQKRLRKNLHMDFVSNLISKQNKTKQKPLYFLSLGVCVCWGGYYLRCTQQNKMYMWENERMKNDWRNDTVSRPHCIRYLSKRQHLK